MVDLEMAASTVLFHALGCFESVVALMTYYHYADDYRKPSYGGQWKYLSYINLHLKLLYFALCFFINIVHALRLRNLSATLKSLNDFFYASVCLPCGLAVFASFWGVYFINRELVHPAYLDEILPQWANHLFHTSILIIIFEPFFNRIQYPQRKVGLFVCALLELVYLAWVLWVRRQSGIWVYSFLKRLNGPLFVVVVIAEILFAWSTYIFGEWINGSNTGSYKKHT